VNLSPQLQVAAGLIVSATAVWLIVRVLLTWRWRAVGGTIIASHYIERAASALQRVGLELMYEYVVDDVRYVGDRYSFVNPRSFATVAAAEAALRDPFAVGSTVTVYYNPVRPESSVLDRSIGLAPLVVLGIGLALLVGGLQGV
jgi:hypothetical protein